MSTEQLRELVLEKQNRVVDLEQVNHIQARKIEVAEKRNRVLQQEKDHLEKEQESLLKKMQAMLEKFSSMSDTETDRELEEKGERYLEYLALQARHRGLETEQVIRSGIPHSEIVGLARELGVDLIAIGQGSRSGPRRSMIGSVAARVVEYAPCPVLVVKPSTRR